MADAPVNGPPDEEKRSVPSALRDLDKVRAPGLGVFASASPRFRDAIYGRDSLKAAEDTLPFQPDIAHDVILTLARLQGTRDVPVGPLSTEEERGRIHHQHQQASFFGRHASPESIATMRSLEKWGGNATSMTYYGSVDATPYFVRLVAEYVAMRGDTSILNETYVDKDARRDAGGNLIEPVPQENIHTIADSVRAAAEWVERRISPAESSLQLLSFQRSNPDGLEVQNWTDGRSSILDDDGTVPDPGRPVATPELQGLAYDALMAAADLFTDTAPGDATRWRGDAVARPPGLLRRPGSRARSGWSPARPRAGRAERA